MKTILGSIFSPPISYTNLSYNFLAWPFKFFLPTIPCLELASLSILSPTISDNCLYLSFGIIVSPLPTTAKWEFFITPPAACPGISLKWFLTTSLIFWVRVFTLFCITFLSSGEVTFGKFGLKGPGLLLFVEDLFTPNNLSNNPVIVSTLSDIFCTYVGTLSCILSLNLFTGSDNLLLSLSLRKYCSKFSLLIVKDGTSILFLLYIKSIGFLTSILFCCLLLTTGGCCCSTASSVVVGIGWFNLLLCNNSWGLICLRLFLLLFKVSMKFVGLNSSVFSSRSFLRLFSSIKASISSWVNGVTWFLFLNKLLWLALSSIGSNIFDNSSVIVSPIVLKEAFKLSLTPWVISENQSFTFCFFSSNPNFFDIPLIKLSSSSIPSFSFKGFNIFSSKKLLNLLKVIFNLAIIASMKPFTFLSSPFPSLPYINSNICWSALSIVFSIKSIGFLDIFSILSTISLLLSDNSFIALTLLNKLLLSLLSCILCLFLSILLL